MQLNDFLAYLLTPAGCGVAVKMLIDYLDNLQSLPTEAKFWLALLLSWLIPILAYVAEIYLHLAAFSFQGLFLVAGVAFMVSQGVHRVTK